MTTLRSRIFIITSVVVLLILAISVFLVAISKKKDTAPEIQGPATTTNMIDQTNFPAQISTPAATTVPSGVTVKPPTSEEVMKNAALQTAKIFVERYGSYSTDNNYQNIIEVEALVSRDLWSELSKKMSEGQAASAEFYGVSTKAVASLIADWQTTKATVEISTIRTENKNGAITTSNQRARVWVEKSGDNWVVDKFEWAK